MASLLDDIINAYGSAWNQMAPTVDTSGFNGKGSTASNLMDALNASQSGYVPSVQTGDKIDQTPTVIAISPQEAAAAAQQQAQQAANATPPADPARIAQMQQQAASVQAQPPIQAPVAQQQVPQQPQQPQQMQIAPAQGQPDINVDTGSPSAQSGGLFGALAGAGQEAAQDPIKAKGLLSALGDTASSIGDKLKSLSPAASQALIASGLTMLANNDGQHNLSQLVGQGGIAGLNQYQTITQNQIANRLASQKLAQDLAEKQATNQLGWFNAGTQRLGETTKPVIVKPGEAVGTQGGLANGQTPQMITGPNGSLPVARTADVQGPDGTMYTQGFDMWGRPVGQPAIKNAPYTGELSAPNQKAVNDLQTTANNSALALTKTQNYIKQLTPTIPDPNNPGQTIPNPDYTPVTGGVAATAQNELNKLTGSQSESQLLRQQIQQNVRLAMLQGYKGGIGGRLTNTDVNLLQQGMPPDTASGTALLQYLNSYAHLQEDQATHDAKTAQFATANRGDMSPLHREATIAGVTYPAGTPMADVLSGKGGSANTSAQQAQSIISRAQAAARGGNKDAQDALKQRGLSW